MQLFPTPENKAPPGIRVVELFAADKVKLRAAFAVPKNPKGTVLLANGRSEFIERYFETMNDLMKQGFAVATFDWRGQGGSQRLIADPKRGYVRSFADYDLDIDAVYSRLLVAQCPKPFYGLGHSTGSHLMLRALRGRKWLDRVVLSAPLMGFHYGSWPRWVARGMAIGATTFGMKTGILPGYANLPYKREDFPNNPLTSDRRRWDRDITSLEHAPQLAIGGPTFGWFRAALNSMDELQAWPEAQGPSCPTLIVMAGLDRVVNNDATKMFLARAPGFSSLTIADSQHEILNEKNAIRQRFLAAFNAFVTG
ncbi:alpha/beta fold hydrolase [Aestuariivirga litoralis]|uniref:alpha/beta fold hydrolase n=1 Tax=Aestuariivirga litoralis TaxID=2650924 RepID=UPI0018C51E24|nr:alpha/beta hydrolase [Aestuariivirga litoralis]MBG1233614.1 alpha/beta hydrolase [Aestuariivirga litoralis]